MTNTVNSLSINPTAVELTVGASKAVTISMDPNAAANVTWKSNYGNVASVSGSNSGATITGMGAGTATITATAGGKSATCAVTVTE